MNTDSRAIVQVPGEQEIALCEVEGKVIITELDQRQRFLLNLHACYNHLKMREEKSC